ncbi:MAG: aminotransferase, partial [Parafannyhessea umbonata]|nr:aminotransferase [Parafannyhessea umbonata]
MSLELNHALEGLRPSAIRRFSALAAATPGCISLTLGEPGEVTPVAIRERVGQSLAAGKTHYPPNNGTAVLRQAIAN